MEKENCSKLTMADIEIVQSITIDELRSDKSKQKFPLFKYQHVKQLLANNTPAETIKIWNEAYKDKEKDQPFDAIFEIRQINNRVSKLEKDFNKLLANKPSSV